MKEEQVSIVDRASYHFHNLLVRGTYARIIAFTIVTVAICLILGFILSLVPSPDGDLLTSLWNATLCALDGGTIAGMEANDGQKAVLFVITLFGIVFTSMLVGIITTGMARASRWRSCWR
jgi:amino acid transporter